VDELCSKFNKNKTNFLKKLIKFEDYHEVKKELNSDLSWSHKMMISYMESSQNWIKNVSTHEHLELDYFNSEYNWSDSQIFKFFTSDNRVAFKEEIIDKLFQLNSNNEQTKFEESIEEISLKLNVIIDDDEVVF
jgi:cell fate regulator YaaT (PSP1 superfamily)